jgi:hypothetical protein
VRETVATAAERRDAPGSLRNRKAFTAKVSKDRIKIERGASPILDNGLSVNPHVNDIGA